MASKKTSKDGRTLREILGKHDSLFERLLTAYLDCAENDSKFKENKELIAREKELVEQGLPEAFVVLVRRRIDGILQMYLHQSNPAPSWGNK